MLQPFEAQSISKHGCFRYSKEEGYPWAETAVFLNYILTFWKVVNLKTSTIGQRKRDPYRNPVRKMTDSQIRFFFRPREENWLVNGNIFGQLSHMSSPCRDFPVRDGSYV